MEENEKAVAAMRQFLEALGLDLQALGMEKTPHRVAQAFGEFFSGLRENPDDEWQAPIATQSDGLVVVRNIRFHSMCEHHLLPFFGSIHSVSRKNRIVFCDSERIVENTLGIIYKTGLQNPNKRAII